MSLALLLAYLPYAVDYFYVRAAVWMLCPVVIGGLVRLCDSGVKNMAIWCAVSLAYGGIWYADAGFALLSGAIAACSVLLWKRRILCVLPLAAALYMCNSLTYMRPPISSLVGNGSINK